MEQKDKFSLTNIVIIIDEIRETVTKFGNSFSLKMIVTIKNQ